ncbi:MAG: hypothetical protein AB7H96_06020 [Vicinamibacterales bacterium]
MNAPKLALRLLAAAALVATSAPVFAQAPAPATEKFFLNANVGGNLAKRTLSTVATATVYEEPARLDATYPIGSGVLFDFGTGYRVFGDVYVGVTVAMFSKTGDATTLSDVPDPVLFDRPRLDIAGAATGLKRSELSIIPQVMFVRALTDKVDLTAGVGPTFVRLKQDVISSFTVANRTQNVTPVTSTESANGTGIAVSVDLTYALTSRLGFGGFARFAPAKVDLAAAGEKVNVAGMQAGAGIRLRF